VRPPLPPLDGRVDRFDLTIGAAVEFLRGTWPELQEVRFEIGALPANADADGIPRWHVDQAERRIVLFRIPIAQRSLTNHDLEDLVWSVVLERLSEVWHISPDDLDPRPR